MVLYHSVSALGIARRVEPATSGECWVDGSWSTLSGEIDVEFTSPSSGELKLSRFTALLLGGRLVVPVYMCVCVHVVVVIATAVKKMQLKTVFD